eukprot:4554737-Amphidinium_carterae.1
MNGGSIRAGMTRGRMSSQTKNLRSWVHKGVSSFTSAPSWALPCPSAQASFPLSSSFGAGSMPAAPPS